MGLNRYLTVRTLDSTGTHFQIDLLSNMDNVSDMHTNMVIDSDDKSLVDAEIPSGFPIGIDYFLLPYSHEIPTDSMEWQLLLEELGKRNIYVSTSVRHPLRRMGTDIRKSIFSVFHDEFLNGVYDTEIDKTKRDRIAKLYLHRLDEYRIYLESVYEQKNSPNLCLFYIDKFSDFESKEDRIIYIKNVYKKLQLKWSDESISIVERNNPKEHNSLRSIGAYGIGLNKSLMDFHDEVVDGIFNSKLVDGVNWREPLEDLCESELVTEMHGYKNVPFTVDEFGIIEGYEKKS